MFNKTKNDCTVSLKKLISYLLANGVSKNDVEKIEVEVKRKMKEVKEPKIAWIGFTGVGKSSTINALFNAGQEISDVRACTKKEVRIYGNINKYTGSKGEIIVYDMPGLGEDLSIDENHYETYKRVLPKVDIAIWCFHAGDRAMTPMQTAILKLKKEIGSDVLNKFIFAVNKADAIAPGESGWNQSTNMPGKEQQRNIEEFKEYIESKIMQIIPDWKGEVVVYSAKKRYNLDGLMYSMISAMDADRRWVLNERTDLADFTELIDSEYKDYIIQLLKNDKGVFYE